MKTGISLSERLAIKVIELFAKGILVVLKLCLTLKRGGMRKDTRKEK